MKPGSRQWFWATLILSCVTIVTFVFAAWELMEKRFFRNVDYHTLHFIGLGHRTRSRWSQGRGTNPCELLVPGAGTRPGAVDFHSSPHSSSVGEECRVGAW